MSKTEDDLGDRLFDLSNRQLQYLGRIFKKIAASYSDDPGTSDLDDSQPCHSISFNLGEVRLVRQLLR